MRRYSLKEKVGCLLLDIPRIAPKLFRPGRTIDICNRRDILQRADDGPGVRCEGRWMSPIHACAVFPYLGRLLLRKSLSEWPFEFKAIAKPASKPDVTFILPFRGRKRLPLLKMTIQSILGQAGVSVECIVVEQSSEPVASGLPAGVRYIHLPHPFDSESWRKAWAFNVGVEEASADIVICHDADILAPRIYASEVLRLLSKGRAESAHIQRFLFRLGRQDTEDLLRTARIPDATPEEVWQNWQGGTLAIRKEAFYRIGGYDERFTGWGGEDNEFFDRCSVLRQYAFGYLPFIHLWHHPQEAKNTFERDKNIDFLNKLLAVPPLERISEISRIQYIGIKETAPDKG